jgi:ATP-dependent DNA ligase
MFSQSTASCLTVSSLCAWLTATAATAAHVLGVVAHWVKPILVADIGFTEWTSDGRLRHHPYCVFGPACGLRMLC